LILWNGEGRKEGSRISTVQDIPGRLTETWNDFIFEDVQSVFREWQIRLNWVMENGGDCYFE
jgi:hypothetical protein